MIRQLPQTAHLSAAVLLATAAFMLSGGVRALATGEEGVIEAPVAEPVVLLPIAEGPPEPAHRPPLPARQP